MPDIHYYIDVMTKEDLLRLRYETGINNDIQQLNELECINLTIKRPFSYLKAYYRFFRSLKRNAINNIVVLGGDTLSEYYATSYLGLIKRLVMNIYVPSLFSDHIFLIGHTIGPFHSWRVPVVRMIFNRKKILISTRDYLNYTYSQQILGLNNIFDSADLAFLDLPKQSEASFGSILSAYELKRNRYISVVPSGLWRQYHNNWDEYIQTWCNIIQYLNTSENTSHYNIVLLPHVVRPRHLDDRRVIREICQRIDSDNIIPIYDELMPSQARCILGNGYFTITGRMHAAVSTFQMNKPAICLSYSAKYKGVIGEGLKRNDLIIEATDDSLYRNGVLAKTVADKVNYIDNNYPSLIREIKSEVKKAQENAIIQIDLVKDTLMR